MAVFSNIAGVGSYLPDKVLNNHDFEKMVDTTDAWITSRTGIRQRHIASKNETVVSMAATACQRAIKASSLDSMQSIDLIVVATCTPERAFPSTACLLQEALGIDHCTSFDVSAACSGFMHALQLADLHIKQGKSQHALVVGSEVMSQLLDWSDRSTCVLFGDGAGAVLLTSGDQAGVYSTHLHSQSQYKDLLFVSNGPKPTIQMQGNAVFKIAVQKLAESIEECLANNNMSVAQLDWLVPHQANARIIRSVAERLDLPEEKIIMSVSDHGNTSAASIPLALDVGVTAGKVKRGQLILLESFGGGFTWGSSLIRY